MSVRHSFFRKEKKMSEENSLIYCSECGSGNPSTFKYCSNCGAKLQHAKESVYGQSAMQEEQPAAFEKVDAEVVSEGKVPITQEEININYDRDTDEGVYSSETYTSSNQEYYSSSSTAGSAMTESETNGNIGFSIASMVCGIMSILCCCLGFFSLVLAIAAIVLGIVSISGKYDGKGMAIAGIITGGFGIVFWLLGVLITGSTAFMSYLTDL